MSLRVAQRDRCQQEQQQPIEQHESNRQHRFQLPIEPHRLYARVLGHGLRLRFHYVLGAYRTTRREHAGIRTRRALRTYVVKMTVLRTRRSGIMRRRGWGKKSVAAANLM